MIKIKNLLNIFLLSLLVLTGLRIILYFSYLNDFSTLNFGEIINAFLMGIRVDVISLFGASALFILVLFLPFRFTSYKIFQKAMYLLIFIALSIIVLIQISDMVYYEHVHRHIANEIILMQDDLHIVFDMAQLHYFKIILYIVFELILYRLFFRLIDIEDGKEKLSFKNILIFVLVFIILLLGIRSNFSGKPFGLSDAFTTNKSQSGNLSISGFFSLVKTITNKNKIYKFYNQDIALKSVLNTLESDEFYFTNKLYPLSRTLSNPIVKKHNVVIVMLEGWSAKYIDSFSKGHLGVTKNFDKLAKNGIQFSNFFANGQRSIHGVTSIFTGIPALIGFNNLGRGLELSNLSYLGNIAKENNYSTLSMQSSKRGSYRMDSISKLAGFDKYYGAEDIPSLNIEEKGSKPKFGVWDNDMLSFYHQKINDLKEPFLSFAFTSTTHSPFISPGKKWEKYEHNQDNLYGYLNTLNYADEALGNFMNKAEKEPWFDNTIFVFLADHTVGFGNDNSIFENTNIKIRNKVLENLRIPLLLYAPKIFKQAKTIDKLGSQADILPTVVDLLGWKGNISTMSNSLFSKTNKEFVLFSYGNILGYINNEGYIKHTLEKELENTTSTKVDNTLLSMYQVLSKLLATNKIKELQNDN